MITGRKIAITLALMTVGTPFSRADWVVRTVTDGPKTILPVAISAVGELRPKDGPALPASAWYSLRRTDLALKEPASGPVILWVNGDCLPGRPQDSDGTILRVNPLFAGAGKGRAVSLPLSSLAGWFRRAPDDAERAEYLGKTRNRDLLLNRRDDLFSGTIESLDATGFHLKEGAKTSVIELETLDAVLFNPELARSKKTRGRHYLVRLSDGTRLTVPGLVVENNTLTLTTFARETIAVPMESVLSVDVEQGPAVFLTDLKQTAQDYQSFDGETRSARTDLNCLGNPLRLNHPAGESSHARGLGLSGGMTVTYDLAGKHKRLETLAGMDARAGRLGEVVLVVKADGRELNLPNQGRIGSKPIEISLDVSGCKTLTITVRRDRRPGVQEALNLADARLIP